MIYLLEDIIIKNQSPSFINFIKDQLIKLYSQLSDCTHLSNEDFLEIVIF